jgi:hypothetical protein
MISLKSFHEQEILVHNAKCIPKANAVEQKAIYSTPKRSQPFNCIKSSAAPLAHQPNSSIHKEANLVERSLGKFKTRYDFRSTAVS